MTDSSGSKNTASGSLIMYKFYHHIIKYSFLTFVRCHFTEGKEWVAVYQPPNSWH